MRDPSHPAAFSVGDWMTPAVFIPLLLILCLMIGLLAKTFLF